MKKLSVLLCLFILIGSTIASAQQRHFNISFAERVAYQRAIEEVYWKHTIWPADNPQPKPALEAVMPESAIRLKTEEYLRKSNALASYWHRPITADALQAEIDRMARETRDAAVLRELWAVLGNDPYIVAECLGRPLLVDRVTQQLNGFEQWWAQQQRRVEILSEVPAHRYRLTEIKVGASFDPLSGQVAAAANSWTATTTTGAPSARVVHTAVWTGTQMIVWGGFDDGNPLKIRRTGGRYTPSTDSWTATTTTGAPSARYFHTAVWTGTQMIVWGGVGVNSTFLKTGGRYTPSSNSWTSTTTTGAPSRRNTHTAVWSGTQMIVWGGFNGSELFKTGGRYTPSTNSWTATTMSHAPSARAHHTAVWSGTQMIVWGGPSLGGATNTGGRYTPSSNSWTSTTTIGAPSARNGHTAVWTGTQMIVWGGLSVSGEDVNTGGRYTPSSNSWTATTATGAPSARSDHTTIWTGTQMIVWGGGEGPVNTGGRYTPSSNSWTSTTTTGAPSARYLHTAVWTSTQMIVWGGYGSGPVNTVNTGGRYTP